MLMTTSPLVIRSNGAFYIERVMSNQWPYVVRPYPDLGTYPAIKHLLKERKAGTDEEAQRIYRHLTREAGKAEPAIHRLRAQYQRKTRGSPAEVEHEMIHGRKERKKAKERERYAQAKTAKERAAIQRAANEAKPFSFRKWHCIDANPIAQVFVATHYSAKKADPKFVPGDCIVAVYDNVLRGEDGKPLIFDNPHRARDKARTLWEHNARNAPWWREGDAIVFKGFCYAIYFNPVVYGAAMPFIVWDTVFHKPVYADARPKKNFTVLRGKDGKPFTPTNDEERELLAARDRRIRLEIEAAGKEMSTEPKRHKTISGALATLNKHEALHPRRNPKIASYAPVLDGVLS